MPADRCRVTVVGSRQRVDLALPLRAPISEYLGTLVELCEPAGDDDVAVPAWSLAPVGRAPFPLGSSLEDHGVLDGAVLYLQELATEPPLVGPVGERDGEGEGGDPWWGTGLPWDAPTRIVATTVAGLLWLGASAPLLLAARPATASALAALLGAALVAAATLLRVNAVAGWLVRATALAAVPFGGVAGAALARGGTAPMVAAGMAGATVAALAALAIAPSPVTLTVPLLTAVAGAVAGIAAAAGAGPVEAAALTAVAGVVTACLLPRLAALLVALAPGRQPAGDLAPVRRLHTWLAAGTHVVLAASLVVLGTSEDAFAQWLALAAAAVLLARLPGFRLLADALPLAATAVTGLFTLEAAVAMRGLGGDGGGALGALPVLLTALVLVGLGALLAARRRWRSRPSTAWSRALEGVGLAALLPLCLGVFGVTDDLVAFGRGLL